MPEHGDEVCPAKYEPENNFKTEFRSGGVDIMENRYDCIIIGGGPAGLSAAIYMARAQYRTLVIEKEKIGGQITITSEVVNYPGILHTSGANLTETMQHQAKQFGAEFLYGNVTHVEMQGDWKSVDTTKGTFKSFCVLFATGASPRKAGFRGEDAFQGHGVAYCATCDGEFFTGKEIFVIGGGYAAAEEALFLTKYGKRVTMCIRRDTFSCAKSISDKVMVHPKIRVLFHTEIVEVGGDTMLRYAMLKDNQTNTIKKYTAPEGDTFGVFVFAGYVPRTELFQEKLQLTKKGYLEVDATQKTSVEGVYGAGDVCDKVLRQIVTAVSDGAVAAVSMEKYAAQLHEKLHVEPFPIRIPEKKENRSTESRGAASHTKMVYFSEELREQMIRIFGKLERPLILRVERDNSSFSKEMARFTKEVCEMSDQLQFQQKQDAVKPRIAFCREDGTEMGLSYYAIPGGHELNSFVSLIYHAAGKKKEIAKELQEQIAQLNNIHLEIAVTLSCTMCPATVIAAGQITMCNPTVGTDIIDVNRFPKVREKYHIMSVPCIIANGTPIAFGKKSLEEMVQLLLQHNAK